ncbi:MAG TPA: penicillin-binding transpeptidase domain-containing protein [Euzebyales bacterium]
MLVLTLGVTGCGLLDQTPDPMPAAVAYATDLEEGVVDTDRVVHAADAATATEQLGQAIDALGTRPRVRVIGQTAQIDAAPTDGGTGQPTAEAHLRVSWGLPTGTWAYDAVLPLVFTAERWKVDWRPSILHPRLTPDVQLALRTTTPQRGPILARDGAPIFSKRPVVTVYVQPRRMRSPRQVTHALQRLLDIDPATLRPRIAAADPVELIEVITLRMDDYAPLRSRLQPVPGLVFRRGDRMLTPDRAFARAVLGHVGPPTAEVLDEIGFGFDADDTLGLAGLQRRFQRRLAGTPGVEVITVDGDGGVTESLHHRRPQPGEALRTTLAMDVQHAADDALASLDRTAALVAIRPSTGDVLAVAHSPGGGGPNLAFTGRYPPGSTFKIVSAAALLAEGARPDDAVACPRTSDIDGRAFRNADGVRPGRMTLLQAFARSCNTAFVGATRRLDASALDAAARAFGVGGAWNPGIEAYTGQAPVGDDPVEQAATVIGQGRVLVSPLLMATVAATVQDGHWRPPVLLPDHARAGEQPKPIDHRTLRTLRRMMRASVSRGTARALSEVPGSVLAKTGTAQFVDADRRRSHAWVVAARDDVAVAVVVEDAGNGGRVAAPIAARFLEAL